MQDVTKCINEISCSNSVIYSTLDLTSGFWEMLFHPKSPQCTAFTFPGIGQLKWITSSMGLLGCPASFHRLVDAIIHGITNIIVYIDDLIIHSTPTDNHLKQLNALFLCLVAHNLKAKQQKCVFGSKQANTLIPPVRGWNPSGQGQTQSRQSGAAPTNHQRSLSVPWIV